MEKFTAVPTVYHDRSDLLHEAGVLDQISSFCRTAFGLADLIEYPSLDGWRGTTGLFSAGLCM